jgi:photosystem II stability/assembly factor-like uncharacterized protein
MLTSTAAAISPLQMVGFRKNHKAIFIKVIILVYQRLFHPTNILSLRDLFIAKFYTSIYPLDAENKFHRNLFLLPLCVHMKPYLFILIAFCLPASLSAQWKKINNPSNNKDLFDVHMIGATAYVVGQNSALLKSVDTGKTWSKLNLSIPENMRAVFFLNKDTGFFIGENARIQKTSNGGSTWTQKYVRTAAYGYDIHFRGQYGISVGKDMLALSSNNLGESWAVDTTIISNKRLNSVCILPNGQCWAVGDSGYILNKHISRRLWENKKFNSKINLTSITSIGDSILIICGGMPDSATAGKFQNIILLSANGGSSFSQSSLPEMKIPNSLHFLNADTGFICGSNGLISKSYQPINNRGLQITGSASSLNSIFFSKNIGLSVGDGGSIYRTTNRGGYGLSLISNKETPFSVYPNPSNGVCAIGNSAEIENIKVYNALGEEIQFEMNADLSQIRIDAKGLFIIQIQSKNSVYCKNILVY